MEQKRTFDNVFYIEDMTSLRYAVPFVKAARILTGTNVVIAYDSMFNTKKYNTIPSHLTRLSSVFKENDIDYVDMKGKSISCLHAYCVENTIRQVNNEKLYSFQHGFDFTNLAKNNKSAVYLVTDKEVSLQIGKIGLISEVQPIPVMFWDWEFHLDFIDKCEFNKKKSATLFYPEEDLNDFFRVVYDNIASAGYMTYVKQRRKNQAVPNGLETVFYDTVWYPSEAVILPMISDVCIGFGTSAYIDIVHLNRQYIDFAIPEYSKKYYKPTAELFTCISQDFYESLMNIKYKIISQDVKLHNPCDYSAIETFLRKIL